MVSNQGMRAHVLLVVVLAAAGGCERDRSRSSAASSGGAPPSAPSSAAPAAPLAVALDAAPATATTAPVANEPAAARPDAAAARVAAAPDAGPDEGVVTNVLAMTGEVVTAEDLAVDGTYRRAPGADLAAQLDEVKRAGAEVRVGERPDAGAGASAQGPSESAVRGRVVLDTSSSEAPEVSRKIASVYLGGLRRCYKDALKRDPSIRGALRLSFTVLENGRTRDGKVTAPDAELGTCVEGLLRSWVFPRPRDADGEPTEATHELTIRLTPE